MFNPDISTHKNRNNIIQRQWLNIDGATGAAAWGPDGVRGPWRKKNIYISPRVANVSGAPSGGALN